MFRLMRKFVIVGALAVPFLFTMPDSTSADPGRRGRRDGYWNNYWGWYDRDYRPYYNRQYRRGYSRSPYYYYDNDFGFSYNPYRNNRRYGNRFYGNRYYSGYRGNSVGIGPLQFYWR